jgi:hypothetical protein
MPGVYRHPPRIRLNVGGIRTLTWRQPGIQPGILPELLPFNNTGVGIIYSGSGEWLGAGSVPPVQIGDTFIVQQQTYYFGWLVTVGIDGTVVVRAEGSTARDFFQFYVYRRISGTIDGPGTIWINDVAPVWASGVLQSLTLGQIMSPITLQPAYVNSPEGDTLNFTYTGTLPPGLSLSAGGVLYGTPTTPGTYNSFTIIATDLAQVSTPSPQNQIFISSSVVASGPTDNIKVRAHLQRIPRSQRGRPAPAQDWQTQTRAESEKTRRIARKLRLQREGREEEPGPTQPESIVTATPPAAPGQSFVVPGSANHFQLTQALLAASHHEDDQRVMQHLAKDHQDFHAFVAHALRLLRQTQ